MSIYLDAVLESENYTPIFNGVREATISFLQERKDDPEVQTARVVIGETLRIYTVEEYLNIFAR